MDLTEAIRTNGTCRHCKIDPVSDDHIVQVLEAAQFGPSGSNRQPVRFLVVRDAVKRRGLQDLYLSVWADHHAQHMANVPVPILLLATRDEGLGSTLTTSLFVVEPEMCTLLDVQEDVGTATVIGLGWPAKPFPQKPKLRPLWVPASPTVMAKR